MDRQDIFNSVVAALHDAMLDDARWPATTVLIDDACGIGNSGSAVVVGNDSQVWFARAYSRGQPRHDLTEQYFRNYFPHDERVPRVTRLQDSRLVHIPKLYTEQELKTSVAYNEGLRRTGGQNGLNVRLDGPHGSHIVWAISDPLSTNGWESSQVEMIERLLPHIRQYVQVRDRLAGAEALGASMAELLDNVRLGVIHLDGRGRIVEANDRALDILRRGDALCERDGLLSARLSADHSHLLGLLAGALEGESLTGGSMVVRRRSGRPGLGLQVSPLGPWQGELSGRRVSALVLVADPASRGPIDGRRVSALLGLKPSEGRAAALLAEGLTVRDIASSTGWRESYVRWLLMQVYRKQDLSGQADLVRLVLALEQLPDGGH